MIELNTSLTASIMNNLCKFFQTLNILVVIDVYARIIGTSRRIDAGRLKHVEADSAFCPSFMITQKAFTDLTVTTSIAGEHGR